MGRVNIDTFIISWTGQHSKASTIARALLGKVDRLTAIYSDRDAEFSVDHDRWIRVPNEHFFGKHFERCLAEFDGDILLLVTADAECHDWPLLASNCERAFAHDTMIGVWAPNVKYSPFNLEMTSRSAVANTSLYLVSQTDSIYWALSKDVIGRLKSLDFSVNNLGWGIDTFACAFCHSTGRLVVVDADTTVFHPLGTGYSRLEAQRQQEAFWAQMTPDERSQCKIIRSGWDQRHAALAAGGSNWQTPIARNASCPCGSGKRFKQCHGALI